jgi:hypothetical protein
MQLYNINRTLSMTEVVTVSAVTAAYASQALRPSARVSGSSPVERTIRQLNEETMRGEDGPQSTTDIIGTSAMTLFFLTSGQKRNQPQTSRKHAEEEYLLNNLDETVAPPVPEQEEEIEASVLDDLLELAPPVLALPDLTDEDPFK